MGRKNLVALLSFILVAISCHQNHGPTDSSSLAASAKMEGEVREVVMQIWKDAASGDTVALKAVHLNSPKFSKFGPRISMRQDVKNTMKTEAAHFSSLTDATFEVEDLKVDIFGDVAITTFYNNYSYIKNDIRVQGRGRVTLAFLRTEEGWKIIHEHSSPFNE